MITMTSVQGSAMRIFWVKTASEGNVLLYEWTSPVSIQDYVDFCNFLNLSRFQCVLYASNNER